VDAQSSCDASGEDGEVKGGVEEEISELKLGSHIAAAAADGELE
jgi:hypothetical protein